MTQFYNHQAYIDLNDSQKEAVKNLDGPLLVLSGAGTGKTNKGPSRFLSTFWRRNRKN